MEKGTLARTPQRSSASSPYAPIYQNRSVGSSPLASILASPMIPDRLRKSVELRSAKAASAPLRAEADMLGAASEAKAVVTVLKKRLKGKSREEALLAQEVRAMEAKVAAIKNELLSEVKSKEMVARDLEDEKSKLVDLRLRYAEKGKEEVQHLKKVHQLEIQMKDVTARLENKVEGERYAMIARKEAKSKLSECEKEIMSLKYDNASIQNLLDQEKSRCDALKTELSRKQNQLMRENHANKVEIEGLQKVVLEKEATASELQAEVKEANEEVRALTEALEQNTENAEAQKSALVRQLQSEYDRIARLQAQLAERQRREGNLVADIEGGEARESLLMKQLEDRRRTKTELDSALTDTRKQVAALEERLSQRQRELCKLQTQYEDAKCQMKTISEKIEAVEAEYRIASKQLRKEQQHVATLEAQLHEETLVDEDRKHAIETAKAYTKVLEDRLQASSEKQAKAEAELSAAATRISDMERKLQELRDSEDALKAKLEEKLRMNESLDKQLCDIESETVYFKHQSELKLRELRSNIESRSMVIGRLERQLQIATAKSDNLKQLMEQTNEEALEAKGVLERRITEVQAKDAKLRSVIAEQESEVGLLKDKLDGEQDRMIHLTAELGATEKELIALKDEHTRRVARLNAKLAAKTKEAEAVGLQLDAAKKELSKNTDGYNDAVRRNEQLTKDLRHEEMAAHKLENQSAEMHKLEVEAKARIASLEDSLALLNSRLSDKVEEASNLRKQLNACETKSEFQQQQLRDEEDTKLKLQDSLERERKAIDELERELKFKEGQFEADSLTVKARITELQNALIERAEATERLTNALAAAKQNSADLRDRLDKTMLDQSEQRATFERLLDNENAAIQQLSAELADKKVRSVALAAELQRNEESLSTLESKIQESKDAEEILRGDVDMQREEASMLQEKLDKRSNFEKDLMDQLEEKEQLIAKLKATVNQRSLEEKNMVKAVQAAEKKTLEMRAELGKKKQTEEALIRELEAAKQEFSKVSPAETVSSLEGQMQRAEASRAEYANVLLKILRREGVSVN